VKLKEIAKYSKLKNRNMKIQNQKMIENSAQFNLLLKHVIGYFKPFTDVTVSIESICSFVGNSIKSRQTICLTLSNGSWIRFCTSPKEKQLEITSIGVVQAYQNKGYGKYLMKLVMTFVKDTLGYIPSFMLECTGNLDAMGYVFKSSIQKQTKFFRKFGFRVTSNKGYPYYVKMELDFSKVDNLSLTIFNLNQYQYNQVA